MRNRHIVSEIPTGPGRAAGAPPLPPNRVARLVGSAVRSGAAVAVMLAAPALALAPADASAGAAGKPDGKPVARCYPPQGEPVPAAKIMKELAEGRNVELTGRIIDGSIDADQIAGPAPDDRKVSLRVIPGRLRLDSCRVTGRIALSRSILQEVMLTCGEILGDLDLSDTDVRGGVALDNERVVGEVRLVRARLERDLTLKNAIVEDNLEIAGCSLHSVNMTGSELRRGFDVSSSSVGPFSFSNAKVTGPIKFDEVLFLNGLTGVDATFTSGLTVDGCRVKGPVSLNGTTGQGGATLSSLAVEGFLAPPFSVEGPLVIDDVTVGQNLLMIDSNYAEATINRLSVIRSTDMTGSRFLGKVLISDTDFGPVFNASEVLFDGDVEFRKVRFPGDDPMEGILFAKAPSLVDTTLPRPPRVKSDEPEEAPDPGDTEEDEDDPGPGGE